MKKRLRSAIYVALICLICISATQRITRQEYIDLYKNLAIKHMIETGIPASITLAQACLESSDGNSRLAREANNHFGIKCHGWEGESISHDDDAKGECFRKYDSSEQSFQDHSDFLRYRSRYSSLFDLKTTDYKGWAYGLQAAGYATSPTYAQGLIKIIEDFNLSQYDILTKEEIAEIPPTPALASASFSLKPKTGTILYRISLDREIREVNGVPYIVANGSDTYKSLAKEYNLFRRELLSFNDLKHDGFIPSGAVVYLEKKKKESAKHLDKHVVEEGETMYSLSQHYAIQLKYLYKYNNMTPGTEPQSGQIILLRPKR